VARPPASLRPGIRNRECIGSPAPAPHGAELGYTLNTIEWPARSFQAAFKQPLVAALGAFNCGGPSMVALNFYHYGDDAAETAARETPLWQAWIQEHFPTPSETSQGE